jgi:hypothetical protein
LQRRYLSGGTEAVRQGLLADHDGDAVFGGQGAVTEVTVRRGGYAEEGRPVFTEHFSGIGINRNLPAPGKEAPAAAVNVGARGKNTVRVRRYRAGMGTGFFTEAVVFQKARYAPKSHDGGFDRFHSIFSAGKESGVRTRRD